MAIGTVSGAGGPYIIGLGPNEDCKELSKGAASGATWTAPADGFFTMSMKCKNGNYSASYALRDTTTGGDEGFTYAAFGCYAQNIALAKKGHVYKIQNNTNCDSYSCHFNRYVTN